MASTTSKPRGRSASPGRPLVKQRRSPSRNGQRSSESNSKTRKKTDGKKLGDAEIWTPKDYSGFEYYLRTWIGPMITIPGPILLVNLAALAMKRTNGSIYDLLVNYKPLKETLIDAFPPPNLRVARALALFVLFQFILLSCIPGKSYYGPISPAGERPVHTKNGGAAFVITFLTFFILVQQGLLDPAIVYDELQPLMTLLSIFALVLCVFLFFKGLYFPSTKDHGSDYPYLFRFYEGEELYPRLFGVDLKNFVICRLGMMAWAVFTASFTAASYREHNGHLTNQILASAVLNFLYVTKFFLFYEEGYMNAGDIVVDRFGFMLCYGTIAFMPLTHNLQTLYLVKNAGWSIFSVSSRLVLIPWFLFGALLIYVNYDADTQRLRARASNGRCKIWGKKCEFIRAKYTTADGNEHENLLIASGYNGLVRHFHYLPDIGLLFMYCSPAGFDCVLPHLYFLYLTSLLVDRTYRIDKRCQTKYGPAWTEYCKRVPYKLIPGVF